jgi:5'-nucleotidase
MAILVDMDGPLANFEEHFYNMSLKVMNRDLVVTPENRVSRNVEDDYPSNVSAQIRRIMYAPNFFSTIPPVEAGLSALKEMLKMGLNPIICTAPLYGSTSCAMEKLMWVEKYLGREWVDRVVIARDKTLVKGLVLIDDNVQKGAMTPHWIPLLYDQPHNIKETGFDRIRNWENWQDTISLYL